MIRFRNKIILVNTKVRFFTKNYSLSLIYLFPVTFVSILSSFTLWILCLSPLLLSVLCMYVRLNQTLISASMDFPSSKSPSHLQFLFFFLIFGELLSFTRSLDDPSTPQDAFGVISLSNNSKPLSSLSWQGRADALGII